MLPPAFVDVAGPLDSAVPVCNCHRRRNSLPGPGKFNTVHHSSPGHTLPVNSPTVPTSSTQPDVAPPQPPISNATPVVVQDVPEQYIVDQLHRLGAFYWHKPETTDCTIRTSSSSLMSLQLFISDIFFPTHRGANRSSSFIQNA